MADTETALVKTVVPEPVLVIRPTPSASLKYQTDTTAVAQPEGVILHSPLPPSGTVVRETFESTSVASLIIR
jgi:hypothetical protein